MHISKITFNTTSVFKNVIKSGYELHQAVWDLFGDHPDRKRDFLYRLEKGGTLPLIYAVSERKPLDRGGIWEIENKEYSPKIKNGMKLGFSVRVNPTVKRNGKRHDVVMDAKVQMKKDEQKDKKQTQEIIYESCKKWLEARAGKNGFKIIQFRADGYRQIEFNKSKDSRHIRFSVIDITGILEVADKMAFEKALFNGIGAEKSFGCGLMMVKKI